jgi:Fibronectin type III domain
VTKVSFVVHRIGRTYHPYSHHRRRWPSCRNGATVRTPHLRLLVRVRLASLVVALSALAVGGVLVPAPVHALDLGPEVTAGRLLPLIPSGEPPAVGILQITPDYVVYIDPALANPYLGELFSVRRVADGSLVTTLPNQMPGRNQPQVSGNSVVQVTDSLAGTQATARPLDPKGRTWTVAVPSGDAVQAVTQEGVVATLPRGTQSDAAVVLLRDGQPDLVLPMRLSYSSADRLIMSGDGRTMVMSNGRQMWALNLVTGDGWLLASKDLGSFDRIQMTANRVFWVDAEWAYPNWQDRVSWVGWDGSPGGSVVADAGIGGYNYGYIGFGDRLAILHVSPGGSYNRADLEPLDLATGARQPAVASLVTVAHSVGDGRAVVVTGDTPNGRIVEVGDDGAAPRTIVDLPVNAKIMSLIRLNGGRVDADFGGPFSSNGPILNTAADGTSSTWSNEPKPGLPAIEGGMVDVRGDTWLTVMHPDFVHYWKDTYRLSWPGGHRDVGDYPGTLGRGGQLWASAGFLTSNDTAIVYDARTGLKLATVPALKPIAMDGTTIWQSPDAAGVMTGTDAAGARPLRAVNTGLIGCSLLDGQVAGRWALVSCPGPTTWAVDLSGVLAPWKLPAITAQHWDLNLGNGFVTWAQLAHDGAGEQYMQAVVLDLGRGHGQHLYGPLHGKTFPPLPVTAPDDAGAASMVYLDAVGQARVVDLDWLTPPPTVPPAPTDAAGTAGNGQAVVSWTTAAQDGGPLISAYTVAATPGGKSASTTGGTTATVIGLTNGTPYTFTVTATGAKGAGPASAPTAAVTPSSGGSGFTALTPRRVLDTRLGLGAAKAKVGPGGQVTWTVPDLPSGATAVALNVTVTNPSAASYLTVYPAGQPRPTASNLNFVKAQTIPNLVIARVGAGNKVTFYNAAGTVDVIADLAGYYAPGTGAGYTALTPLRVLDTRAGLGTPKAKVGPGGQVTLTLSALPAGTTAVALNVTVTNPSATSYLTAYPAGQTRPTASNLNFVKAQTIPNLVIARVGAGNKVTFYNAAGTVDVIADLAGYYAPSGGAGYTALTPRRVLDTRLGLGAPKAKVGPGGQVTLTFSALPAGTTAVALNVTATNPSAASYLTAYPAGQTRPTASNLNFVTAQTIPNLVIARVGAGNKVTFYDAAGTVDVIADLAGYYSP